MNPFELEALKNHPDTEGPVYMVNLIKSSREVVGSEWVNVMRTTDTGQLCILLLRILGCRGHLDGYRRTPHA